MRIKISYQTDEKKIEFNQAEVIIGRSSSHAAIDLDLSPDKRVSRRHARIKTHGGIRYTIEDLGSKHGTWVDGVNLAGKGEVPLNIGTSVYLGDTVVTVVDKEKGRLSMQVQSEPVFNYSLAHIGIPLFSKARLTNESDTVVHAGKLQLFVPGYGESEMIQVGPILAGASEILPKMPRIDMDYQALRHLIEPEVVRLDAFLDGRAIPISPPVRFTLLPPNAWHMLQHETALAAFVMPECAAIKEVVARGEIQLERLLGAGQTFVGVLETADPNALERSIEALYLALVEWYHIEYAYEPVHRYALDWQSVRFHQEVLHDLKGTCIDLSVLFAACLEQVHRDPVLLLVQTGASLQHALVGYWREESLVVDADPVVWDSQSLLRWVTKGDLLVLDVVGFARSSVPNSPERCLWMSFEEAHQSGLDYLRQYPLRYGVDITTARSEGIAPMPFGQGVQFERSAQIAVQEARKLAKQLGSPILGVLHLVVGLLKAPEGLLRTVVARCRSGAADEVARLARSAIGIGEARPRHPRETKTWGRLIRRAQYQAEQRAGGAGAVLVTEADLIHALLESSSSGLEKLWKDAQLKPECCLKHLEELRKREEIDSIYLAHGRNQH